MPRHPAFGWAAQYGAVKGRASLALAGFPYGPIGVLLELAAWVLLAAAIVGRPRRTSRAKVGEP